MPRRAEVRRDRLWLSQRPFGLRDGLLTPVGRPRRDAMTV
jgi:hypothetical protein